MKDQLTIAKVREIDRWHKANGWSGIGYHFFVDRDGTVADGRPLERIGAHVQGHNTGTIGICLAGGHGSAKSDQFSANFTQEQDKALRKLVTDLRKQYPSIKIVSGHNQYASKACPGFYVPEWYSIGDSFVRPDVEPIAMKAVEIPSTSGFSAALRAFFALFK